jgi:hypothetical protein
MAVMGATRTYSAHDKASIRKRAVLALVERNGTARTFHIEAT